MIRIGDFSKLSRVSIKALRYYDAMGLLTPVSIDRFTGYRSYEFHQLPRLYRIVALKDLGFSLEEIGQFLASDLSTEQLRGMLLLRQAELRQRVVADMERLERVATLVRQIEQEDLMSSYAVVIKAIPAMMIASVRGVVATPSDQDVLWGTLMETLTHQQVRMSGTPMAIYHDPDYKERDWDIEVCLPIADAMTSTAQVNVSQVPACAQMACVVHTGSFATIGAAYDALAKWIDQHGYRIAGPGRELNLRAPEPLGNQHDPHTVNEIQFPVEKVSSL